MAPQLPTFLPSASSPTGQELPIYTYNQLQMVELKTLQQRALDLKSAIAKCEWVAPATIAQYRDTLRVHAEAIVTIKWCLDVQILILKNKYTLNDFGLPQVEAEHFTELASQRVFEGKFPTIKKTKESIMSESPTKGPINHDVPLKRPPSASPMEHGTRYMEL